MPGSDVPRFSSSLICKLSLSKLAEPKHAQPTGWTHRLAEFGFSLPENIRYAGGELKGLLKYAYRGILPDSVLDRRKKGFSTPRYYFGAAGPAELQKSIFEEYHS